MDNFMGLFLVLVVGCALGVVVSCCDLTWATWRHPRDPERPFLARLWSELRFVFRFEQSVKPLRGALTPPPSEHPSPSVRSAQSQRSGRSGRSERSGTEPEDDASPAAGARRASSRRLRSVSRRSSMHAASVRLARHTSPR